MGQYYIYDPAGIYYELDATTSISSVFSGEATDFPLESGETVADHYINSPTRISMSGVISDVKSAFNVFREGYATDTRAYIEGLQRLKTSKVPFTLYYSGNLDPLDNCVFEQLEITQDQTNGSEYGTHSYKISFTAKQIRFGEAARILAASEQDKEYRDVFTAVAAASGNTQEVRKGSQEEEQVKTAVQEAEQELDAAMKHWAELLEGEGTNVEN